MTTRLSASGARCRNSDSETLDAGVHTWTGGGDVPPPAAQATMSLRTDGRVITVMVVHGCAAWYAPANWSRISTFSREAAMVIAAPHGGGAAVEPRSGGPPDAWVATAATTAVSRPAVAPAPRGPARNPTHRE